MNKTVKTMIDAAETAIDIAERRAERFDRICEHFEADGPDCTVPGAAKGELVNGVWRRYPRYALVELYGDKGRAFVNLADDPAGIKALAAEGVGTGAMPVCYFDLDQLAGPEPPIAEGDRVRHPNAEGFGLPPYTVESIELDQDGAPHALGERQNWLCEILDVLERVEPDERLPLRYDLAEVVLSVVFNSAPRES